MTGGVATYALLARYLSCKYGTYRSATKHDAYENEIRAKTPVAAPCHARHNREECLFFCEIHDKFASVECAAHPVQPL